MKIFDSALGNRLDCDVLECKNDVYCHFLSVQSRMLTHEKYLCSEHAIEYNKSLHKQDFTPKGNDNNVQLVSEVDFETIVYELKDVEFPCTIVFCEKFGKRRFRIEVNWNSYRALYGIFSEHKPIRPSTYLAWISTIKMIGGDLIKVILDKNQLEDDNYLFGKVVIKDMVGNEKSYNLQANDAVLLALANSSPIFISERGFSL